MIPHVDGTLQVFFPCGDLVFSSLEIGAQGLTF